MLAYNASDTLKLYVAERKISSSLFVQSIIPYAWEGSPGLVFVSGVPCFGMFM